MEQEKHIDRGSRRSNVAFFKNKSLQRCEWASQQWMSEPTTNARGGILRLNEKAVKKVTYDTLQTWELRYEKKRSVRYHEMPGDYMTTVNTATR